MTGFWIIVGLGLIALVLTGVVVAYSPWLLSEPSSEAVRRIGEPPYDWEEDE